jgi:hypothetical protein
MSKFPTPRSWLLLIISLLLSGCMALPFIIPPLVEFGADLLTTAANNYGDHHKDNMENMLVAIQQPTNPTMPQGIIANPYNRQTGGYQQNGYPNQDDQTAQGYPSAQDSGQQPYDPYPTDPGYPNQQASAPEYSPYPQNQYPQQGQQAEAYPNNQNGYSNQNPYPNQAPYPNQTPYPAQGQPYPDPSYPMDQQGQSYPTPYGNPEMAPAPAYPNQPQGSPDYQTAQSGMAQPTATPISLDVLLVKKHMVNGVRSYLPIKDGDTLFDGRGNPQAGDKFRVMFRANTDGYVYVIAVDGSAWAQGIFPTAASPFANPVKAGQQYLLPEGNNWFSLDQFKGIETIFFVASHGRRPDIEQILTTITGRERHPAEKPMAVSEPAIIPNGYSGARPGSAPFAFKTSQRSQQELLPTTYFVKTAREDLRITRWFRHQ